MGAILAPLTGDQSPGSSSFTKTITQFNFLSYNLKLPLAYNRASYLFEIQYQVSLLSNKAETGRKNQFIFIAEIYPADGGDSFRRRASMGPRLVDRGNCLRFAVYFEHFRASMGPRLVDRGNFATRLFIKAWRGASMGPRLVDRGNSFSHMRRSFFHPASMGPRLVDRGNVEGRQVVNRAPLASMGPRLVDRGNGRVLSAR